MAALGESLTEAGLRALLHPVDAMLKQWPQGRVQELTCSFPDCHRLVTQAQGARGDEHGYE